MDIGPELYPVIRENKIYVPAARYYLSNEELMLIGLKIPDRFVFKLSRCVSEKKQKFFDMKSYDYYMFIQ